VLRKTTRRGLSTNELWSLYENMISPFLYLRMVYDENDRPVDCIFLSVNRAYERESGKTREEIIGKTARGNYQQIESFWFETFGRVAKTGVAERISGYFGATNRWLEIRVYSPRLDHIAITVFDITKSIAERESLVKITQELKTQKDENYRIAHEEPITGLPNRSSMEEAFESRILSREGGRYFPIAIFTPDNLAEILASYGSVLSDRIMRTIAQRVKSTCRDGDSAFSMTGTDIVLLLSTSCDTKHTQRALMRVQKAIQTPVEVDGNYFFVSATGGVACYPKDGTDRDELIMKANLALYQAKESGAPIVYFNQQIASKLIRRTMIRNALPNALENKEFELYFQPQVQTETGCLLGFEALLRWNNTELGNPSPMEFIGVAEESRQILPIGAWVLRTACKTLRQINEHRHTDYYIAVNVSGVQLFEDGFIDQVFAILQETGLPPEQLELEVTESVLLKREMNAIGKLNELRKHGLRIALDDFGIGYSSLGHLKDLEISTLKIDKSFIQDPRAGALTEMMVRLGHLLEAEIVAEGVETKEQQAFARVIGCERIQGYLEAKPMPIGKLRRYIESKYCEL